MAIEISARLLRRTQEKGPRTGFAGLFDAAAESGRLGRLQAAARCALMAERVRTIRLSMGFSGSNRDVA
jgi:hypothetical protein